MSNDNAKLSKEKLFEVITYENDVSFSYTDDEGKEENIECEITFIWEDTLEKFFEKFGSDKPYDIRSFRFEDQYNFYVDKLESRIEAQIEEIEESIASKSKFGFEFTGSLMDED